MKVLITGGAGFLGWRLAKKLLETGTLKNAAGQEEKIDRLVLLDIVPGQAIDDPRVVALQLEEPGPSAVGLQGLRLFLSVEVDQPSAPREVGEGAPLS